MVKTLFSIIIVYLYIYIYIYITIFQILPGIMNEDAGIRNMAVRSLGMCCLLNKDLVLVHLPLFMQVQKLNIKVMRING